MEIIKSNLPETKIEYAYSHIHYLSGFFILQGNSIKVKSLIVTLRSSKRQRCKREPREFADLHRHGADPLSEEAKPHRHLHRTKR